MLKILIKKQFAEVFKAYFYNRKTNKPRSKANIILMFAFFGFLMIGVMGGMFTFMALGLCGPLHKAEMGWLYFALMSGIAVVLGAFGSVFNTYSGLYLPKDNDLLLCMPIPVRTVIAARLINVYLLGVMYSAVVLLPTMIVYWIVAACTAASVIGGILLFLIVSLIVLMLSVLLGWVVAKISVKLKNKSFLIVLIALLLIAAYYFVYFQAQQLIRELVVNAATYGTQIKSAAFALFLFGRVGEGDWLAAAVFVPLTAGLTALVIYALSRSFLKLATADRGGTKTRYREKAVRAKSPFTALLVKEFRRFKSSPNYMLNCGLGVILLPALGVFLLIKGDDILRLIAPMFGGRTDCAAVPLCAALMLVANTIDTAAPSVSLEGSSLWIPRSLPVRTRTVLAAKTTMQLLLSELPMLPAVVCMAIVVPASPVEKLLLCLLPLIHSAFAALFHTFAGTRNPMLDWTSEIVPIKQSGAVTLALLGGWGVVLLFAAPYLFVSAYIDMTLYLAVWAVIFLAASALLLRWIMTKGVEAFEQL